MKRIEVAAAGVAVLAVMFAVLNWFGEGLSEERPNDSVFVQSPSQRHALVLPDRDPTDQARADREALADPAAWRPNFTVGLQETATGEADGAQYCADRRYLLVLGVSPPASPDDVLQTFDRDTCFPSGRMIMTVAADGSVSIEVREPDGGASPRQVALAIASIAALLAVALHVLRRSRERHRRDRDGA